MKHHGEVDSEDGLELSPESQVKHRQHLSLSVREQSTADTDHHQLCGSQLDLLTHWYGQLTLY